MLAGRGVWAAMLGSVVLGACGGSETGAIAHFDEGAGGAAEAGQLGTGGRSAGGRSPGGTPAGGGEGTGGRAPAPDASTGTGGAVDDAGAIDAAPDAPEEHDVYVSPTGSDSATGTRQAPFQTIAHAAAVVTPPRRIVLLAGTFDETTQPSFRRARGPVNLDGLQVPAEIVVASDVPRAAHLVGSGVALWFPSGGEVRDIVFEGFDTAIRSTGGSLSISGNSFAGCGRERADDTTYSIEIIGGEATLTPGGVPNYVSPATQKLLLVGGAARATVAGGKVAGISETSPNGAIFEVVGTAQLTLTDLLIEDNAMRAVIAGGGSTTLRNVTIQRTQDASGGAIELTSSATLSSVASRVIDNAGPGVTVIDGQRATFQGTEISRNSGAGIEVSSAVGADVTAIDCAIDENGKSGIVGGGKLTVASSTFYRNGEYGISTHPLTDFNVRLSTFEGNALGGLFIRGFVDATIAPGGLGNVASPGNNIILGTLSAPGVVVDSNARVSAVGNTWRYVQGADTTGRYTVTGPGATLVDTWDTADLGGSNYLLAGPEASLRLAENP